MGVDRGIQDVAPTPEDLLRSVAVVDIDVQDRDVLAGLARNRLGRDRRIVEEAVTAGHRPRRVVARRPTQPVDGPLAAIEDKVDGGQGNVNRTPCSGPGPLDERIAAVQPIPARAAADGHRFAEAGQGFVAHALEHRPNRIGVGDQE